MARFFRPRALKPGTPHALVLILGLAMVLVQGCAAKKPAPPESPGSPWSLFQTRFTSLPEGVKAFKITASMLFSTPKQGHRTVLDFWGDFYGPVRLDVTAGIGAALAHVRDDPDQWLAVLPGENKAYEHGDALEGQQALGIPLPFTLQDLARMASGDYSRLVQGGYAETKPLGGATLYLFGAGPVSALTLEPDGTPLRLQGPADNPWDLNLSGFTEDDPPFPKKMELLLPGGQKALLRIKSRQLKVSPWPEKVLELPLPENIIVYSLSFKPGGPAAQDGMLLNPAEK